MDEERKEFRKTQNSHFPTRNRRRRLRKIGGRSKMACNLPRLSTEIVPFGQEVVAEGNLDNLVSYPLPVMLAVLWFFLSSPPSTRRPLSDVAWLNAQPRAPDREDAIILRAHASSCSFSSPTIHRTSASWGGSLLQHVFSSPLSFNLSFFNIPLRFHN